MYGLGMTDKKDPKQVPEKGPDATSPVEALNDAMKPTELGNKPKVVVDKDKQSNK